MTKKSKPAPKKKKSEKRDFSQTALSVVLRATGQKSLNDIEG